MYNLRFHCGAKISLLSRLNILKDHKIYHSLSFYACVYLHYCKKKKKKKKALFFSFMCVVTLIVLPQFSWPVGWGCKIHWLHLCRGVNPPPTSVLDMTLNNLMELSRMQSTPSLPSLPGPVVAPDRVLSMGQIELNGILMLNWVA